MSKKANPTLIGLFTLIGLLLAGAVIVVLGAGKFFDRSHRIVLYFDKSAYGLQVGSDVRFGGVRIGRVDSIHVLIDPDGSRKIIPVIVDLGEKELSQISTTHGGGIDLASFEGVKKAVDGGLRARMKQQSLLTGQLYIEFDIVPDTTSFTYQTSAYSGMPSVPTVATEIDELIAGVADGLKKLTELDLNRVIDELHGVLVTANKQVGDLDMKAINDNLVSITGDVRAITGNQKIPAAIDNLDEALKEIRTLAQKFNTTLDPLSKDFALLSENANASLLKIQTAAEEISRTTNARDPLLMRMQNVIQESERTSRAIKELANDLKRNPNSILSGKSQP